MNMLVMVLFLGATASALTLSWMSIRDELGAVASLWAAVRQSEREQAITITYPGQASLSDGMVASQRSLRPHRPRSTKVPSHRLHAFSRLRRAA
ncbi:hypothetical protein [Novosphingobium aquimarinum]|uniref:hypothetical protein n=1 Tax=Novosphingobium aquimarinum TaxID=2682494 RepID=UPI0012EB9B15|nr:hypothetical protein [Novosphingobium aquimarinum]